MQANDTIDKLSERRDWAAGEIVRLVDSAEHPGWRYCVARGDAAAWVPEALLRPAGRDRAMLAVDVKSL